MVAKTTRNTLSVAINYFCYILLLGTIVVTAIVRAAIVRAASVVTAGMLTFAVLVIVVVALDVRIIAEIVRKIRLDRFLESCESIC